MPPRFSELQKVRVIDPTQPCREGFVVLVLLRDGEWIYKLSIADDQSPDTTFDNWYRETALEMTS